MKRSGFYDCLAFDQVQRQAVEFERPGDQSTELDAAAEVSAFVDRSAPSAIEVTRAAARSSDSSYSGSNRNTPLAEAAGFYSSGQR